MNWKIRPPWQSAPFGPRDCPWALPSGNPSGPGVQIASEGIFFNTSPLSAVFYCNTSLLSAVNYYNTLSQFSSRHFPCKTCQQNFVQVNSLIQPFLYFAINRRLQEDLIRKMQFCSSRETNDVTKVPKLTIWQTSPYFNTDISIGRYIRPMCIANAIFSTDFASPLCAIFQASRHFWSLLIET